MAEEKRGNLKIEKPHLIVCEGKDDKEFLTSFLKSYKPESVAKIQIIYAKGESNIPIFLKTLHGLPNFAMLRSLAIIRDADDNPSGASQSIRSALGKAGFAVPDGPCLVASGNGINATTKHIKVAYALFPKFNQVGANASGAIENLCMEILDFSQNTELEKISSIAQDALKAVEGCGIVLNHRNKNELYTYFSLTNEFVGKHIRYVADGKAFDFTAKALDPLKKLMQEMLEE